MFSATFLIQKQHRNLDSHHRFGERQKGMETLCENCGIISTKKCRGCGTIYCSDHCQRKAWKEHKSVCSQFKHITFNHQEIARLCEAIKTSHTPMYNEKPILFVPFFEGKIPRNMHRLDSDIGEQVLSSLGMIRTDVEDYYFVCNMDLYLPMFFALTPEQRTQMTTFAQQYQASMIDVLEEKIALGTISKTERDLLSAAKKLLRNIPLQKENSDTVT